MNTAAQVDDHPTREHAIGEAARRWAQTALRLGLTVPADTTDQPTTEETTTTE